MTPTRHEHLTIGDLLDRQRNRVRIREESVVNELIGCELITTDNDFARFPVCRFRRVDGIGREPGVRVSGVVRDHSRRPRSEYGPDGKVFAIAAGTIASANDAGTHNSGRIARDLLCFCSQWVMTQMATFTRQIHRRRPSPLCVQQRARRHGIAGIHGNRGNMESVTYRIYEILLGSNPTLSESLDPLFQ
jgi:hypothetical protein